MKANKTLGQHFLKDKSILRRLARLALPQTPVVEIGAGRGELTSFLSRQNKVLAIEKDNRFKICLERLPQTNVLAGDIRDVDLDLETKKRGWQKYQVFGNLPFYLEKPIIQQVLTAGNPPRRAIFLINKEVVRGFGKKKTFFALSVEYKAKVKLLFSVSKRAFSPIPGVDGQVIMLYQFFYPLPFGLSRKETEESFFAFLKAGFSHPRKKLWRNLADQLGVGKSALQNLLQSAKIDLNSRAEELGLRDWFRLVKIYESNR